MIPDDTDKNAEADKIAAAIDAASGTASTDEAAEAAYATAQWDLVHATHVTRLLDKRLREHNLFCGIAGGVLTRGWSAKDLDLVVLPLRDDLPDFDAEQAMRKALRCYLTELVGAGALRGKAGRDNKHVSVWLYGKRRIDIFLCRSW